ncbi:MAG: nucleotidyltransferase domain-containing protein [Methylobacter sp.]|nr:nucleotidyltransferase domain-containing protein [Methylobacter sp.]MDP2097955.1 nucleotidyltransferase domain-containing protein [Methylobacter sp.]MDP2429175.1 nucleotidyltransferase domain-containing protein [Methylobacter sp.]MDP3053404.1 nucleotidyltransferase domain-containing protein [Methylobacter sp.]MDP3360717.1 nucleotidyltransferase domain-containing protein [Methylobacter sp.]
MRLTLFEIKTIQQSAKNIFGDTAKVYLFGSRVDDKQKGGDIDLYVVPDNKNDLFEKKIKFLTALHKVLGEQKIDVVFATDPSRPIEQQAIEKGVELNLQNLKIDKVLNECSKHLQRINEAYSDMSVFMPLTATKYQALAKDEVQAIDQYLFRFAKLQDSMGEKLFRLLVARFEGDTDRLAFLDVLKKIEKYIDKDIANEWLDLRNIRNQLAHEYEDDAIEMANSINLIYAKKEVIEGIYLTIAAKCNTTQLNEA